MEVVTRPVCFDASRFLPFRVSFRDLPCQNRQHER
jgi:hypothetical protein